LRPRRRTRSLPASDRSEHERHARARRSPRLGGGRRSYGGRGFPPPRARRSKRRRRGRPRPVPPGGIVPFVPPVAVAVPARRDDDDARAAGTRQCRPSHRRPEGHRTRRSSTRLRPDKWRRRTRNAGSRATTLTCRAGHFGATRRDALAVGRAIFPRGASVARAIADAHAAMTERPLWAGDARARVDAAIELAHLADRTDDPLHTRRRSDRFGRRARARKSRRGMQDRCKAVRAAHEIGRAGELARVAARDALSADAHLVVGQRSPSSTIPSQSLSELSHVSVFGICCSLQVGAPFTEHSVSPAAHRPCCPVSQGSPPPAHVTPVTRKSLSWKSPSLPPQLDASAPAESSKPR
jgi:hypothetical protein